MTLHIFNPEHDMALASNLAVFTSPHAGRRLRHDLGYLPALWAADGDAVLTDDAHFARAAMRRKPAARCLLVEKRDLRSLRPDAVEPWGWDAALRAYLLRNGVEESLLPTEEQVQTVRRLSHRRVAAKVLQALRRELPEDATVGEALECGSADECRAFLDGRPLTADATQGRQSRMVMKAPWSSSGRGLRFASTASDLERLSGWTRNVLTQQGSVMAEPYYNKVKDFGMEFVCREGGVDYLGLSLFVTANGAYTGNLLATEQEKREQLSRYLPTALIDAAAGALCRLLSDELGGRYTGPLGVDMMVVAAGDGGFLLHPCVEINLRRTMGHVALSLAPTETDRRRVMRIDYNNDTYKLKLQRR